MKLRNAEQPQMLSLSKKNRQHTLVYYRSTKIVDRFDDRLTVFTTLSTV